MNDEAEPSCLHTYTTSAWIRDLTFISISSFMNGTPDSYFHCYVRSCRLWLSVSLHFTIYWKFCHLVSKYPWRMGILTLKTKNRDAVSKSWAPIIQGRGETSQNNRDFNHVLITTFIYFFHACGWSCEITYFRLYEITLLCHNDWRLGGLQLFYVITFRTRF